MKDFQKEKYNWFKNGNIYQVFIDRFSGYKKNYTFEELQKGFLYGNIQSLSSKLDYIQSMNFNIIWLTPFFANQSLGYHGYHVINFNHADPRFIYGENPKDKNIGDPFDPNDLNYLTESDKIFKDFIDKCHKRNIKIIMDYVINHVHESHPFFQQALKDKESKYFKWFYIKNIKKDKQDYLKFLNYDCLPKLNLDFKECGDYMINVALHYLNMGIDGIRLDFAIGPSKEYLIRFTNEIHNKYPDVPIFGEILPFNLSKFSNCILGLNKDILIKLDQENINNIIYLDEAFQSYEGILDGVIDFSFFYIINYFVKGDIDYNKCLSLLDEHYQRYQKNNLLLLKVLDSHDSDRLLFRCNQDKDIFKQCLELLYKKYNNRNDPLIFYYGTEDFMTQTSTIYGENYGDYKCRMPMKFYTHWIKNFFKEKNE